MAGGQLAPVTLVGGSSSSGGRLAPLRLSATGHNGQGLQLADSTLFAQGTTGHVGSVGTLSATLQAAGFVATAQAIASAAVAQTLADAGVFGHDSGNDVTLVATGTVRSINSGGVLHPLQFAATGTVQQGSALVESLDGVALVASGTVVGALTGASAATLDQVTLAASGTVGLRSVGAGAATLSPATLSATGTSSAAVVVTPDLSVNVLPGGGGTRGGRGGGKARTESIAARSTPPAPQQRYAQVTKSKTVFGIRMRHAQKLPEWSAVDALRARRALEKLAREKRAVQQHNLAVLAQVLSEL